MTHGSEKAACDCNIIRSLGSAAEQPAILSLLEEEKASVWILARPVRLYTLQQHLAFLLHYFTLIGLLPIVNVCDSDACDNQLNNEGAGVAVGFS